MYLIQFPDAKGNKTLGKYRDCFQVNSVEFESTFNSSNSNWRSKS